MLIACRRRRRAGRSTGWWESLGICELRQSEGEVGIWGLAQFDASEEDVRRDIDSGGYLRFEMYVTWGRKV